LGGSAGIFGSEFHQKVAVDFDPLTHIAEFVAQSKAGGLGFAETEKKTGGFGNCANEIVELFE
jgi:hypothetical protein